MVIYLGKSKQSSSSKQKIPQGFFSKPPRSDPIEIYASENTSSWRFLNLGEQILSNKNLLSRPGHRNKSLNFIFPTKYVIPQSLKG